VGNDLSRRFRKWTGVIKKKKLEVGSLQLPHGRILSQVFFPATNLASPLARTGEPEVLHFASQMLVGVGRSLFVSRTKKPLV
jgi:hypothetical protein